MKRRNFVKSVAATGTGLIILPGSFLSGRSPSDKLNIALIGAHGRGSQHYGALESENVVAICDVHAGNMALAAKQYLEWLEPCDARSRPAYCRPGRSVALGISRRTTNELISSVGSGSCRLRGQT